MVERQSTVLLVLAAPSRCKTSPLYLAEVAKVVLPYEQGSRLTHRRHIQPRLLTLRLRQRLLRLLLAAGARHGLLAPRSGRSGDQILVLPVLR